MRKGSREVEVGGVSIPPGHRQQVEIPISRLPTGNEASLPVEVVNGARPGATLWLSAAIHGDEVNGVEIIRNVLRRLEPERLRGTVIAVPIVNVFGFLTQSRYLPDRRDLNRTFPGSAAGSLASRLAHIFMREVVSKCEVGIDLHTGADRRPNVPQIRADMEDEETAALARAFGAPVILHSRLRDGSLREAAVRRGAKVLLFEGGEALRFDPETIEKGTRGVLAVMALKGMRKGRTREGRPRFEADHSTWARATVGGILHLEVGLGQVVEKGQRLGEITDAFDPQGRAQRAPLSGLVVGMTTNPLVNRGDAIVHVAGRR